MIQSKKPSIAKSIFLIVISTGFGVYLIVSTISWLKTVNHHERNGLFTKIDDYEAQLQRTGKSIKWTDRSSVRSGLLEVQRIQKEQAPYLDSLITVISDSSLAPESSSADKASMNTWKANYLSNLRLQKRSKSLLDSLLSLDASSSLLMKPEFDQQEFNTLFANFISNDSAVTATHLVEDSLRNVLGHVDLKY